MHDLDGKRIDRVRLSPAQKHLLEALRPLNRFAYEGKGWVPHFALGYLLADGGVYCILTITHQVAYALHKYAPEHQKVKEALLYGDAFGATWMTEIQGGSDLGDRTLAILEGDRWRLYGGGQVLCQRSGPSGLRPGHRPARGRSGWGPGACALPPPSAYPEGGAQLQGAPAQGQTGHPGRPFWGGGAGRERGLSHWPKGGRHLLHPGNPHSKPPSQRGGRDGNCPKGLFGGLLPGEEAGELRPPPPGPPPYPPGPGGPEGAPGRGAGPGLPRGVRV